MQCMDNAHQTYLRLLEGQGVVREVDVGEARAERESVANLVNAIALQVERGEARESLQAFDYRQAVVAQLEALEGGRALQGADLADAAVVELQLPQTGVQQPRRLRGANHTRGSGYRGIQCKPRSAAI